MMPAPAARHRKTRHLSPVPGEGTPAARCRGCTLRGADLCRAIRASAPTGTPPPALRTTGRGRQILAAGEAAGFLAVVRRGYARRTTMRMDGKRILLDLALPGDILGGVPGTTSPCDLEAATEVEMCVHDTRRLGWSLEGSISVLGLLVREADEMHRRLLGTLWRNGTLTSRERIAAFLVWATGIMPTEPMPDGSVVVTMEIDRRDWADLTNTAVETISRTLRDLGERGLVCSLSPYRFRIPDLQRLAALAGVDPPVRRAAAAGPLPAAPDRVASQSPARRMMAVNACASGVRGLDATRP
ncbi:Crp/Fnr family transcriptional regulator [Rhodovulum sp. 12E13]|uniref:Crp/Fnr family transcriptional regulator n=1 Tax=Rhodovulum sp. 12E13 TaxID=2203891 RepID=UPI00131477AD|nr:Crp/Fnr family transcriptional regulator [Rhodovulum sp. 12E13]